MGKAAKNLVIVESPAKAGTIEKYLGSDYQVMASMGHIRDLPASKIGVDTAANFAPAYVVPMKARKTLKNLKEAMKGKEKVLLATDLDREGEAIAWHISQALELEKLKIKFERITFDEITKGAILEAITKPREIDYNLVDAQQARRVLDRLVGYTLSPILWKKIYKGLSAGRVQSVALRLIVDRERERDAFKPVEYWSLIAEMLKKAQTEPLIKGNLVQYAGKKIEQLTLKTAQEVDSIVEALKSQEYIVKSVEKKATKRRPYAPYTTSTFQQDAVNKLGITAKNAMRAAQRLYESGYITYMRTDSVDLASVAVEAIRECVISNYGEKYLPAKPNFYKTGTKKAQEAHEAIRPTNPNMTENELKAEKIEQKVYGLIRRRAIASQMANAELEQTGVNISAGEAIFRVNGQVIVFPGFLAVWAGEQKDENVLPEMKEGEVLNLQKLNKEQHFTEPPPRYSEATLIKSLEEEGIGRPSTYSPTIDTLMARNYVQLDQKRFVPEEAGYLVTDLLKEHFSEIIDLKFTADMEQKLDGVAEGTTTYVELLSNFWEPFSKKIEQEVGTIVKIDTSEETDEKCDKCGAPMLIKRGRFGKFLACSAFPECKNAKPLNKPEDTGLLCPICGKALVQKKAKRGIFFGCSGYPDCKFAIWKKEALITKIEELEKEGTLMPFKEKSIELFTHPNN